MKGKILIIDDEVDFANLLARRLRLDGYEAACYDRGDSAFNTSRKTLPDLIIMDIDLPDISGLEVYKHMRSDKEAKRIPIVFLSALHEKESHCLHILKADRFLQKTCDSTLILQTI